MIRCFVIGDWGRQGIPEQHRLARQMARQTLLEPPDFIISTGDNFYDAGVSSVYDPLWQQSFEEVYHQAELQIPWHVVLGNHDYDGNVQAQIDYTQHSERWHLPSHYYYFHQPVGNEEALFVFTDTSPFIELYHEEMKPAIVARDAGRQDADRQLHWLEEILQSSAARWKVVIGHHPVYSSSPFHGDAPELIEQFVPLFDRYGVDLYLCGHEHDLQLHQPPGDTLYLVSGAGSEIRETGRKPFTLFSASVNGFARVDLTPTLLRVAFVDDAGQVLYEHEVEKVTQMS